LALSKALGDLALVQTPNLWWPAERSWCVASEIDLTWSFVGGSSQLISALVADDRIEAQPAQLSDNIHFRLTGWLKAAVSKATDDLLTSGRTSIQTPLGSVGAALTLPTTTQAGKLRCETAGVRGRSNERVERLDSSDEDHIRNALERGVVNTLIELIRR
jgi:hypothetical protein